MNHTPTPWDLHDGISITVHQNNQHIIAIARGGLTGKLDEAEANAAFIVRACNVYDSDQIKIKDLAEILQLIIHTCSEGMPVKWAMYRQAEFALKQVHS